MTIVEDANGTKVWVQLEWEQIDAIVVKELKDHIEITARDINVAKNGDGWVHPEDAERNLRLLPALLVVYEQWAGEEEAEKMKKEIGFDYED